MTPSLATLAAISGSQLSILRDARGFVTATGPTRADIMREIARIPLYTPIRVYRWDRHANYHGQVIEGWKLVEEFTL